MKYSLLRLAKILVLTLVFLELILSAFSYYNFFLYPIFILGINIYLLYIYRKNVFLFLIFSFLLWSNYSFILVQFDLLIYPNFLYATLNYTTYAKEGMMIIYVFMLLLFVFSPDLYHYGQFHTKISSSKHYFKSFKLSSFSLIFISAFFLINLFNFFGLEIIRNSIHEYSTILLIFALAIDNQNKLLIRFIVIVGLIAALLSFLSSDRITGLQHFVVIYILFFYKRLSKKITIILVLAGVVFLTYFGANRGNIDIFNFQGLINSFYFLVNAKVTLDTAYSAYFTSLNNLQYMHTIDFSYRLFLFLNYFRALFLGSGYQTLLSDVSALTYSLGYIHAYGSFSPILFYFYLDRLGIIVFSLAIAYLINFITYKPNNSFNLVIKVFITTFFFRWYLYGVTPLIRGLFFVLVIFFVLKYLRVNFKQIVFQ